MVPLQLGRQTLQDSPKILALRIAGDVDYLNVAGVETYFTEMLQAEQPRHVILDFSGLTFVVTPFLGSLLFWKDELQKRNGRLILCSLRPSIDHPMRVLRLHRVLTFVANQEAALALLAAE